MLTFYLNASVPLCVCVRYLAQFWQAHVHARPEASAKVGRTCEDVAQTLIPHELPASLLDQFFHLHREVAEMAIEQNKT